MLNYASRSYIVAKTECGSVTVASDEHDPYRQLVLKQALEHLRNGLTKALDAIELIVLRARFGLNSDVVRRSRREISTRMRMSRKRVKEVLFTALRKLRRWMHRGGYYAVPRQLTHQHQLA